MWVQQWSNKWVSAAKKERKKGNLTKRFVIPENKESLVELSHRKTIGFMIVKKKKKKKKKKN